MTHVPKDTHPWNSLHPEDRFPESRSGAGVEAGATLRVSNPPTWTWEGLWKRVQRKRPPPHVHRGLVQTVLKDVVSSPSV